AGDGDLGPGGGHGPRAEDRRRPAPGGARGPQGGRGLPGAASPMSQLASGADGATGARVPGSDGVVLRLQDVEVRYGPVPALREVTMEVRQGEIVCLLGGNASGKSTTMKAVMGAVRCARGSVWYEGEESTAWPTARRGGGGVAVGAGGRASVA